MSREISNNLNRAIAVADYILEDNGHSVAEASTEFNLCKSTIKRDINFLGVCAFYGNEKNEHELKEKYFKVQKTLSRVSKKHYSESHKELYSSKKQF